jgi:hypothetical protein
MTHLILTLVLSLLLVDVSSSQNKVPHFKDYPISEVYVGKNAPLVLSRDDMRFHTRLREAANEKPNFAGHYLKEGFRAALEAGVLDILTTEKPDVRSATNLSLLKLQRDHQ